MRAIQRSFRIALLLAMWALPWGLTAVANPAERGPVWASLTPAQRMALAPLQSDWSSIPADPKQKWLEVAGRLPKMPAEERVRVQERMAEWSRMTPAERSRARVQFQEVRRLSPEERQTRWQEYQQLPDVQRSQLAEKARADLEAAKASAAKSRPSSTPANPAAPKSSVVAGSIGRAGSTGTVASLQQAKPGATTTTISTRPAPPVHHQAGLPKIVATPGFVDRATLLPQRGPQGAAVRAASADTAQQP